MADFINRKLQVTFLLIVFWALFWSLNGVDKFMNGSMEPMVEPGLEQAVIVDSSGNIVSNIYGYEINGLFGSNRNAKTITFFERIGVPDQVALGLLYGVAIFEVMLAGIFTLSLFQYLAKKRAAKACAGIAYKLSIALFIGFCAVDILIGERIELWEHTTFIVALLLSYQFTFSHLDLRDKEPAPKVKQNQYQLV